ncbi:MAG TPA: hypothetical protein VF469_03650 [Kofleriaceae bacterium]
MLGLATGCERLLSIQDPAADRGDAGGGDDGGGPIDGGLPRSSPILLSEVVLTPTMGEMIEIVNTSAQPVDLSTYYLSDSGNYFRLPVQAAVDLNDFIVKFPQGAQIKGHAAMTIAIDTPLHFSMQYPGVAADYSVSDDSMTKIAMNGPPTLTNGGEPIILFQWDGRSDLVRDVDIVLVGAATGTNGLTSKSGVSQDGSDPGSASSQYAVDLDKLQMLQMQTTPPPPPPPGSGFSAKRIALEAGHETQNGDGNGQSGDDETSEDTSQTWDGTTAHPFTAPTPGTVEVQLP